jgi:hypothetical protein
LVVLPSLKRNDNAEVIILEMAVLNIFLPRFGPFILFHGDINIRDIVWIIPILVHSGWDCFGQARLAC